MPVFAIDFETANPRRSSACSIGITYLDGPNRGYRRSWLIRPDPLEFSRINISIHGITADRVADAPTFPDLWPRLRDEFEGATVVAHNAAFDLGVLRAALTEAGLPYPTLRYHCTVALSRAHWPGLENHRLPTVARHLGIDFVHHDAASDAWVCAQIADRICEELGTASLDEAAEILRCRCGEMMQNGYVPAGRISTASGRNARPTAESGQFDRQHPFFGRTFAFAGALNAMTRTAAVQWVADHGGHCANDVTGSVDYLVLADDEFAALGEGRACRKLRNAVDLIRSGREIELVPEAKFLEMGG